MKARILKSNLSTVNGGHCRNRNNCRYTGATPVWVVVPFDHGQGVDAVLGVGCLRKWLADDVKAFICSREYKGGDIEIEFLRSSFRQKFLDSGCPRFFYCNPEEAR